MSQPTKPVLKLNTRATSFSGPSMSTPQTAVDAPKIKIKVPSASQPPTPAVPSVPIVKTKAGRARKPTAKVLESRKRGNEGLDDSDNEVLPSRGGGGAQPNKKIRILPVAAPGGQRPKINIKHRKGEAPTRVHGEGYDSCASDNEDDPLIEEQIVFRMLPGPDCDYIHECIRNKRIPGQPDFDLQIKFLDNDGKKIAVRVRTQLYAATLLELPTITETMKTWDRKAFMKSADICQLLLVYAPLEHEHHINSISMPDIILPGHKWPHGLTPPMHDCITRRFRKAISKKEIQSKEDEVNRLLELDDEFEESQYFVEKPDDEEDKVDSDDDGERDAEGDIDDGYFGAQHGGNAPNGDAEEEMGDLEQMLLDELEESQLGATGAKDAGGNAQAAGDDLFGDEDDEEGADEDEDEDEDDDEDEEEEIEDENDRAIREEINELQKQISEKEASLQTTTNVLLTQRIKDSLKTLRNDMELKRASIGEKDAD